MARADQAIQDISRDAGADLSAGQYCGVEQSAAGLVTLNNALGEACFGVLQNNPNATGRAATVRIGGTTKIQLGATVAVGAKLTVMANGKFQTAATGHRIVGDCTQGGVNGEVGAMVIRDGGIAP